MSKDYASLLDENILDQIDRSKLLHLNISDFVSYIKWEEYNVLQTYSVDVTSYHSKTEDFITRICKLDSSN